MKNLFRKLSTILVIVLILFVVAGCEEDYTKIDALERHLGAEIPDSAIDLEYNYHLGRLYYVQLSFKVPPDDMDAFVDAIWDELLFPGYDPFNAVHGEIIPGAVHLINGGGFTYYSYSPDMPDTVWGGAHWRDFIRIDKTNPDFHELRYETFQGCGDSPLPPCGPRGYRNFIRPDTNIDIPLMVPGIHEIDGENILVSEEFCVEIGADYYFLGVPYDSEYYVGASIDINIDDQTATRRYVSDFWYLATQSELEGPSWIRHRYNDCFYEEWESGIHTASVVITPIDSPPETYSWEFRVP